MNQQLRHGRRAGTFPTSKNKKTLLTAALCAAVALVASSQGVAQSDVSVDSAEEVSLMVVTGTRTPHLLADAPVETTVISREDIRRSAAANLPQLLRGIPGYTSTNLDDTIASDNVRTSFRGFTMNSGASLILVDGRRSWGRGMGSHNAMNPTMNQVPVSMIERIEVVKGAASSLYGADAMAGVINIITRPVPAEPYFTADGGAGYYDVRASTGSTQQVISSGRASRNFSASYGAPITENAGFNLSYDYRTDEGNGRVPEQAEVHTLRGKATTVLSPEWQMEFDGRLDQQRVEPFSGAANQRSYVRAYDSLTGGLSLKYGTDTENLTTTFSVSQQDAMSANNSSRYMEGEYFNGLLESVYSLQLDRHWVTVGAEVRRDEADLININNAEHEYGIKATIENYAIFAQDEIQFLDERLTVIPGARAERHSYFGSSVSPNLAAMYQLAAQTRLRASIGSAFKSPSIQQLYMDEDRQHSNIEYLQANPELAPETAISRNLSIEHTFSALPLWLSAGVYRNDPKDLVVTVDTGEVRNGLPVRTFDNLDRAKIQGFELAFQLGDRRSMYLNGSASWTDSEDRGRGPLRGNTLRYVPEYQLSLTPGLSSPSGRHGLQMTLTRVGEQYQNDTNTQIIEAHNVVDASAWLALEQTFAAPRLSLDVINLTGSRKGELQANRFRQGRSIRLNLSAEF